MPKSLKNRLPVSAEYLEHLYLLNCTLEGKADPVLFPRKFGKFEDRESAAFIAAVFAFGTISQINGSLNKVFAFMGDSPFQYISTVTEKDLLCFPEHIYHRFYKSADVAALIYALNRAYVNYGTLQSLFSHAQQKSLSSLRTSVCIFHKLLREWAIEFRGDETQGLKFMFPDPGKGSACKRLHLFLRWVVRNDEVDMGLWSCLESKDLIIPVDTHIESVAKRLGMTSRSSVSWDMAEEITSVLRKYDPVDPVRFDFALCHGEILNQKSKKVLK